MEDQKPKPATPDEGNAPEGGSSKKPEKQPMGWVWLIAVVILVAGVLFILQQKTPEGDGTEPADEVASEIPAPTDEEINPADVEALDIPVTVTRPDAPDSIIEGTIFGVDWALNTNELTKVTHTAIHWGTTSNPGELGPEVGPADSGYENATEAYASGEFLTPHEYEDNIKVPKDSSGDTLYMRSHAILFDKNYWSDEVAVPIITVEKFKSQQK